MKNEKIQGNEPNDGDDECEISLPNIVTKSNHKYQSVSDSDNNKKQEKNSEEILNTYSDTDPTLNLENIENIDKDEDFDIDIDF